MKSSTVLYTEHNKNGYYALIRNTVLHLSLDIWANFVAKILFC